MDVRKSIGKFLPKPVKRILRRLLGKEPLLSVIVPVYNVEPYLGKCLRSLVKQSYTRLEIIVVDDGSPDNSYVIAKRFAEQDRRLKIVCKENGGLGAARNTGIAHARGKYITFVDSDDTVPKNAYKKLMRVLTKSGSDFIVGTMQRVSGPRKRVPTWAQKAHMVDRTGIVIDDHPNMLLDVFAWNKIFRRAFFVEQVRQFPTNIRYEDQQPSALAYTAAHAFDVSTVISYNWFTREDQSSITQQKASLGDITDRMSVLESVKQVMLNSATPKIFNRFMVKALGFDLRPYYDHMARQGDEYWNVACAGIHALMDEVSKDILFDIDVIDRCFVHAMLVNSHADVVTMATHISAYGKNYIVDQTAEGLVANLEFFDDLERPMDRGLLRVSEVLLEHRTTLYDVHVESGQLRLIGSSFVRHLAPLGNDVLNIDLICVDTGAEITPIELETGLDITRYEENLHPLVNYGQSGFKAVFDLAGMFGCEEVYAIRITQESQDVVLTKYLDRLQPNSQVAYGCSVNEFGHAFGVGSQFIEQTSTYAVVLADKPLRKNHTIAARKRKAYLEIDDIEHNNYEVRVTGTYGLPDNATSHSVLLSSQVGGAPIVPLKTNYQNDHFSCTFKLADGEKSVPSDKMILVLQYVKPGAGKRRVWSFVSDSLNAGLPMYERTALYNLKLTRTPRAGCLYFNIEPPLACDESSAYYKRQQQRKYAELVEQGRLLSNTWLFESFNGSRIDDSPLAISLELQKTDAKASIYWTINDRSVSVPLGMHGLIKYSKKWYKILATSQYLINNNNFPFFFDKTKHQTYIQTWHGTPLKKIGNHVPSQNLSLAYRALMQKEARQWDLVLAQNGYSEQIFPDAFGYQGEIACLGYPRNDDLHNHSKERISTIRKQLGILPDSKVLLYAPTWRDTVKNSHGGYKLQSYLDFELLAEHASEYTILLRGHPNTLRSTRNGMAVNSIDVRHYPHLSDLYVIADVLVTDYSSVMFDFAVTQKPIIFLAPDYAEYVSKTRGLYLDFKECAPGPIVSDTNEVIAWLYNPKRLASIYQPRYEAFAANYCYMDDGKASERILNRITNSKYETTNYVHS